MRDLRRLFETSVERRRRYVIHSPLSISIDSSTNPVPSAKLYDLGTRLSTDPLASFKISTISGLSLSLSTFPVQLSWYLKLMGYSQLLGHHFFNSDKIPTFALNNVASNPFPQVYGRKNGTMDAPKNSCPGTKGEGAVQWLYLIDNGGSQGGVNTVYRIETAGGSPPATCQGMKAEFTVPYAAQYWIYGAK